MEMGRRRFSLRGGPGSEGELQAQVRLLLSFICRNPRGPPTTILPVVRTPGLEKGGCPLGQFSTAKTGRGGAVCSEEDVMMSE